MYSKIDPKTGAIVGELKDVRALNLPQNIQDNKIVLTDAAKELIKNWEPYELFKDQGGGKTLTIESVMKHPKYDDMRATAIQSLTSMPRRALSILADNGGMIPVFYTTDEDYKKKRAEEIAEITERNRIAGREVKEPTKEQLAEIDFNMVKKVKGSDGTINPELSDVQRARAEEMAGNEIDGQLSVKMSGTTRDVVRGGTKTPEAQGFDTYAKINSAYEVGGTRGAEMLKNLAGGKYDFEFTENGLNVYGYLDKGGVDKKNPLIKGAKNAAEAAQYIYGSTDAAGVDTSLEQYNKEKSEYWKQKKQGVGSTPNKITQAEFNKKWATLKPGQTLVGPNGVTYKKK
jgi:hypothetical protein